MTDRFTPDLDRVYQPEQLEQLAKDLVAARGTPLDPFEKASLRRWKKQGLEARIRRLPDLRLTCWPADLPTSRGPSVIGGRIVAPHDAMAYLRGEKDYGVSVGIHFDKTDLDLLRAAALIDKEDETRIFDRAAAAVENDTYLVVQCMGAQELKEIIGRFREAGIAHITVDTLRVGATQPVRM